MTTFQSGPERDRRLSAKPRYGYRAPQPLSHEISQLLGSETFKRLRRFQRVNDALKDALGENFLSRVRPISLKVGVLIVEVADTPLLAEIKQHYDHRVTQALAAAGTGVSRVQWRLGRLARKRPTTG
jgi:predicted nucleic acid-binding Zn ribbon protein